MHDVPIIQNPSAIPPELTYLGRVSYYQDHLQREYRRTFFAVRTMLVVLREAPTSDQMTRTSEGRPMLFGQVEFPLAVAPWLVSKIEPFLREGLLPGALFSYREEFHGEKIRLGRGAAIGGTGIPGWSLTNYNRQEHGSRIEDFQELDMGDPLLFEGGLFPLWQEIAARYEHGEIGGRE